MANIFISYNREDEDKTKALVDDMQELGHTVWFDHDLSGGQKWWDTILESIRNCDILVFALSVESLNSSACSLEYDYASKLGKTILPVLMGEGVSINLLPPVLSQIQFVDYQQPDRDALLHLAKALTSAPPSQPLPDPLPLPPEVPISYLGKLGKQIESTSKLSYEEQSALLVDLKRGLDDPENTADTRTLLQKLRKQQHLFENIAREIDKLLENTVQVKRVTPHASPETEHTTPKPSQSQEIESVEVHKKPFWTLLPGIIAGLVLIIVIGIGLYFAIDNSTYSSGLSSVEVTNYTKYKVVNVASNDTLNVRTNPFVEPNNKVGELQPYAQNIRILECKPNYKGVNWCKIGSYEGSYALRGWVVGRYLAPQNTPNTSSNLYQVINIRSDDTLAVRNGSGTQYYQIGYLAYDAKGVKIIECQYSDKGGKWCRIKYGNTEGWVSATYLREQ